jgi:hypothetical protein
MKRTVSTANAVGPLMRKPPKAVKLPSKPVFVIAESQAMRDIVNALDLTPSKWQQICAGVLELTLQRGEALEIQDHPVVYERVLNYVNEQLGVMLAVRAKLYANIQNDRKERARRRDDIRGKTNVQPAPYKPK